MRLVEQLRKEVIKRTAKNDSAHDFGHIVRVYKNAQTIARKEKANMKLVLAAALLHDIVWYPKSDPRSKTSSVSGAKEAKRILKRYRYSVDEIKIITEAIRDHSFSRGVIPQTLEGKILQDADRLDAIGAIGIARVFSVGGTEKRSFYNSEDPFCKFRVPDETKWTLDHFYKKLLLLEKKMNTKTAKNEERRRIRIMNQFLREFKREI
ncbi:MAG: HD domain-containing protein [Thaumarchaeota archaeon]|nr:MAG: HD domain-containing protein [Nitrososphaerota archaeon]